MVTLLNYGLGNIRAFENIYKRLNIPVRIADTEAQLALAEKIILPGVGSFDWAMHKLQSSGMRNCLEHLVIEKKCPVLGICVGMQMMARGSEEGDTPGLGWIEADVKRFERTGQNGKMPLPHMGWNDVLPTDGKTLFEEIGNSCFYFLHTYYMSVDDKRNILAVTDYHSTFASAVQAGHIFGVQFHPEKSHQWGVMLLKKFAEL